MIILFLSFTFYYGVSHWLNCVYWESLHSWNNPYLIMLCNRVLLDSVCLNFVENFCSHMYQWYWPLIFFLSKIFVWFLYQDNGGLVESLWHPSSATFWKSWSSLGVRCFLLLVEFTCEDIWPWPFLLLLEDCWLQLQFPWLWLVCLYFLFLPGSVLKGYTSLIMCPFSARLFFYLLIDLFFVVELLLVVSYNLLYFSVVFWL